MILRRFLPGPPALGLPAFARAGWPAHIVARILAPVARPRTAAAIGSAVAASMPAGADLVLE